MTYLPPGWEDLRVPLSVSRPGGLNDPSYVKFADNGAGSQGVDAWHFPAGSERELFFDTQLPHMIAEGLPVKAHVHYAPTTALGGTATFGLEYTFANIGDVFPNTVIVEVPITIAAGNLKRHYIADFGVLSLLTGVKISGVFLGRIYRKNVGTYAGNIVLASSDLHLVQNNLGSSQEGQK